MKKHKLEPAVQVEQAEQIMKIPLFGDVFEVKKWEYFTQWLQSDSVEEREELHGKLLGLLDLQAEFETIKQQDLPDAIERSGD